MYGLLAGQPLSPEGRPDLAGSTAETVPSGFSPHVVTVRTVLSRFADAPAYSGLLVVLALAAGCDREAGPPAPPSGEGPAASPQADDAPIRALYLCANRFVLLNEHPFPVRIAWRVQGTDEHGEQTLKAAPAGDPEFSEVELSVRQEGDLAVYRGDELITVRENERTACEPTVGRPSLDIAGSSTVGEWSAPDALADRRRPPAPAVHRQGASRGASSAIRTVWDPATNTFTAKPVGSNLFCSGHTMLSNGQLFVAGGHISDGHGLPDANIYDPKTGTWITLPPMSHGRWYPTVTELHNGQVLVVSGKDQNGLTVTIPELWTGTAWKELTTASRSFPYYPRDFVAPNAKIFYAGEQRTTRYFNPLGTARVEQGRRPALRHARLRLRRDVPARKDPVRRRRAHHRHGGDDRSQRHPGRVALDRLHGVSAPPPERHDAAHRRSAGDGRDQRDQLQRDQHGRARGGDLESGHGGLDPAREQRGQPRRTTRRRSCCPTGGCSTPAAATRWTRTATRIPTRRTASCSPRRTSSRARGRPSRAPRPSRYYGGDHHR